MKDRFSRRGFLRGALIGGAGVAITPPEVLAQERVRGEQPAPASPPKSLDSVRVGCRVNGVERTLDVHPDEDTVDAVRERLGLTGSKRACGHGACGACTMLIDGTPHATCLLPVTALEGREVTTVEGLGGTEDIATLHPVQRAFMADDALQCGFCTPGFVVEAAAFHDAWRAERGTERPDRDAIAAALSGHLCRCGAYQAIYQAVGDACEGRFDGADFEYVRVDALPKVTGAAKYTVDVKLDGQLEGAVLRAPVGHAIVRSLDIKAAEALDGVAAVIRFVEDGGRVRYAGQEIAAVAAVDARTAREALHLLAPTLEVQPAVASMDAALAEGATPVYEAVRGQDFPNASEGPLLPAEWQGPNLRGPLSSSFFAKPKQARERVAQARAAGRVVEGSWTTQVQCHTTLEPHAAVARWHGDQALEVHLSTQSCDFMAREIAEHFELKRDKVQVLCDFVGGGFGAKATMQMETVVAAELARAAGAPVRVALERAAEIAVGGNRPGARLDMAVAWDEDGGLHAIENATYNDSGVSVGSNTGLLLRIQYPSKYKALDDYDVTSHGSPGKPFRGPGGPPAYFALEQTVDMIAEARGEDPVTLRRRWDPHPARQKLYDWVEGIPQWRDRAAAGADKGRYRRGVGVAAGSWFVFLTPKVEIKLEASDQGIVASGALQDMGNGTKTVLANTLAAELGIDPLDIRLELGDSRGVYGCMSAGSRTTASIAPAVEAAARALKQEFLELASRDLGLADVALIDGGVRHAGGSFTWRELLAFSGETITVVGRRPRDPGGYVLPFTVAELRVGKHLSGSVQLAQVEVDTRLGRVRVVEYWSGIGAGKIVVPKLARSQIEGGVVQGLSYTLYEERRLDPTSAGLLTAGLEDYRVAGIGDIPPIHVHFEESGFENMLGRIVGISELSTVSVSAAVANAVHNATGWRCRAMPIRPDTVLSGLGGLS